MSKKQSFFWASYADLMTSLFFIMLVLFVLTVALMKRQQAATEAQLKIIKELQSAVKELPKEHFKYDSIFKRFSLKAAIHFDVGQSVIKEIDRDNLKKVGKSVETLIDKLSSDALYKTFDIQYLVIIEGMSSNDSYSHNFELSYLRALALFNFWKSNRILNNTNVDIQISGSGTGGIGRDSINEKNNQRFLIQIIPKIGNIDITKSQEKTDK